MASFSPLLRTTISRLLFFPQICHTLPHDATSRLLGLQSSWRKREPSHSGKSRELSPPSPPPSSSILRKRSRLTEGRRPGLPLGLRPPPLLPSQGLYSLAVFFLPPSTSPLSKIMAVVTETTLLASHLPSSIALLFFFFLVPPHNPTSWKVSTPAVFTSLPVVRSAAHSNLASIPPAQLKWLLSPH